MLSRRKTTSSGSRQRKLSNRKAEATLNEVVLMAMPKPSERTAIKVEIGALRSMRAP
ncbi:MAG TPA: hypothetical protein VHR17_12790 [Thermoanaerobaculia bacterium]|nr:hypothetical protein [Thermoanaerobaculia bacterium]